MQLLSVCPQQMFASRVGFWHTAAIMNFKILPSLLAADPGYLAEGAQLAAASGADELHLDIMDGHFVPNISMGPAVVAMARREVDIPLNVHLMLSRPDQYLDAFIKAGADTIHIHIEAECNVAKTLQQIRDRGAKPGITLNPDTSPRLLYPVLPSVDEVLVMTVRPGYGGQSFMEQALPSIRAVRAEANRLGIPDLSVMVDGGINHETATRCAENGANAFVAGTFLYKSADMAAEISTMRNHVTRAFSSE
jgi:ribulose-phosphate 3-epimerase